MVKDIVNSTCQMLPSSIVVHAHVHLLHPTDQQVKNLISLFIVSLARLVKA